MSPSYEVQDLLASGNAGNVSSNTSSSFTSTEQAVEQDIIGGFGFALGGVLASVILLWVGGKQIKKVLKEAA